MAEPIEIFAAIAELISEEDVEAAATGALVDATGEEAIEGAADLLIGGTEGAEGEYLNPIFDEETGTAGGGPDDPVGPGGLGHLTKGQLHALWQDARTFARWTGREIMKGGLFQVALETMEGELAKKPPDGVDGASLQQIVGAAATAVKLLTAVTADWRRWAVKRFHYRADYGMVTVEDVVIYRFEIFRTKLADLNSFMEGTLGPLLAAAAKKIDAANLGQLRVALRQYADMVQALCNQIRDKEHLMVHAGLKDHEAEAKQIQSVLS